MSARHVLLSCVLQFEVPGERQEDAMRHLLALVLSSLIVAPTLAASTYPEPQRDGGPRIRPQDARIAELLKAGTSRSTTFRSLVNRIDANNLIVYISLTPLLKPNLAGKLTWMGKAGGFRYVRAQISTELNPDAMIATLAHELQHAVEVIEDEGVTDQRSLEQLYKRIGRRSGSSVPAGWETEAAQQAGLRVRRELSTTL
jgi:hypothetical protein